MKQTWFDKNGWWVILSIIGIIVFCIVIPIAHSLQSPKQDTIPTPVEKKVIDTLYITRDNYINSIKYLDSIKYDTIQKVYDLNDSATFLLFLQLVSE